MRNKLILFLLCVLLPSVAVSQSPAVKPDHPDSHTVVKGDTLWDISGRFLQEPWRWPEIWDVNPQISNPHLIYPGDVVYLTYRDGRPVLTVNRGAAGGPRYVKLSPEVRSTPHARAIPSIPVEYIKPFLSQPLVVSRDEMEAWPYVVSSFEQHLVAGPGNKIYVRGLPENPAQGYSIFRRGPAYVLPPETDNMQRAPVVQSKYSNREIEGEVLGYQALYVGDVEIRREGDPATGVITSADREVLVGDRLVPHSREAGFGSDLIPTTPAAEIDGKIVSVIDGVSEIGNYQVVVVSAGTSNGLEKGNVLAVYQTGQMVRDTVAAEMRAESTKAERLKFKYEDVSPVDSLLSNIANDIRDNKRAFDSHMGYFGKPQSQGELIELPPEFAGIIMVFRTFDKVSYALVMDTERPMHIYDSVTNP